MMQVQQRSNNGSQAPGQRGAAVVARVIATVWAGFFVVFGALLGVVEGDNGPGPIVHALPGLVFAGGALLAWRYPVLGGSVLLAIGACVVVLVAYWTVTASGPMSTLMFSLVLMALPPIMAGALLVAVGVLARKLPEQQGRALSHE
jgi:hypothetical protein